METQATQRRVTLLTGVTGFLGRETLKSLLARNPSESVLVMIRPARGLSGKERLEDLLGRMFEGDEEGRADAALRVSAVEAELEQDMGNVTDVLRENLAGRRCRLIHGAASVSFTLPIEEARAINVAGTQRMLELAERLAEAGALERFAFVGTAFVAGARSGTIYEHELDEGQRFTNTYEQSKLEAEKLVRSYMDRLPISVFRPSIIAGHSKTGATTSFKMLYWPLKVFARRLIVCIPGDPKACFDIVPVDFVADSLLHILEREDSVGGCYHLAAGNAITLGRAVEMAAEMFELKKIPPYVSPRFFSAILKPFLYLTLRGRFREVLLTSKVFIPYLSRKLVFDNTNTVKALDDTGLALPDPEGYLRTVFQYVKDTDFGRREVAGASK